ncbi:MAG TPA: SpoIIE family protein phosphatase [Candidatus Elarobacter sp.]
MLKLTSPAETGAAYADAAQRRLADALPILVMISDGDGTVKFFNRRWHEFTGQPVSEHEIAQNWQAYMHPADGAGVQSAWEAAVQRGDRVITMRYRLHHHATGQYRWFAAQAVAVEDADGRIVQWIGAAVDVDDEVTARAALEQLLTAQTAVAETYQRASLPSALPQFAGLRFEAQYRASAHALLVGGDWYDVFALSPRHVAVSIGDIAGHGLRAAVVMNKVQQSARAVALWQTRWGVPDPVDVLDAMEETLHAEDSELMATAIFGVIDLDERTLRYASAGHPPPLVRTLGGGVRELPPSGTPLGWKFEHPRTTSTLSLESVDLIVLYTDGVVEGAKDGLDGLRRLAEAIAALDTADGRDTAATILKAAEPTPRDDAALLTIHVAPHADGTPKPN